MDHWWQVFAALAALVLPVDCAGCDAPDVGLCPGCRAAFAGATAAGAGPGVVAWVPYEGVAARVVVAWKDRGRRDLAPVLAAALARSVGQALAVDATSRGLPVLVVPVPSSRAAIRRRGQDRLGDLTRRAVGRERVAPALVVARSLADQAGLGVAARRRNVHGAFAVRPRWRPLLAGRACLVVDDVVTTGASISEAARALTEVGARVLGAATVCATPRYRPAHDPQDPRSGPVGTGPHGLALTTWNAPGGEHQMSVDEPRTGGWPPREERPDRTGGPPWTS